MLCVYGCPQSLDVAGRNAVLPKLVAAHSNAPWRPRCWVALGEHRRIRRSRVAMGSRRSANLGQPSRRCHHCCCFAPCNRITAAKGEQTISLRTKQGVSEKENLVDAGIRGSMWQVLDDLLTGTSASLAAMGSNSGRSSDPCAWPTFVIFCLPSSPTAFHDCAPSLPRRTRYAAQRHTLVVC